MAWHGIAFAAYLEKLTHPNAVKRPSLTYQAENPERPPVE
jgi:hypothetical protein